MKFLAGMLLIVFSMSAWAQDVSQEVQGASGSSLFSVSYQYFTSGKYLTCVEELSKVEVILNENKDKNASLFGLVAYWKGISYNRLQNFPLAIKEFDKALALNYSPSDLNYEYGQALFASEKLEAARLQFRESLKKNHKRGVSLYYIAYISKEMGERKLAVSFYKAISKLPAAENHEVRQAAEMQIGDIYLEQAEKHPDAFRSMDAYVIPQYKLALEVDRTSPLAQDIDKKIIGIQQKYELVLFKMRNGRPTLVPPYFFRASEELGFDSNVVFAAQEAKISQSKQSSMYSRTDALGRYTFYAKDVMSIATEARFNYTRYFNRVKEIYRNDNYLLAPAIRTAFEHRLWKKPASILADYDYNYSARDIYAKQNLEFSGSAHTLMLGERFNFFNSGESIFRVRRRQFTSYTDSFDSNTTSFVYEQIVSLNRHTLLFVGSYDMTKVKDENYDTNAVSGRADLIFPKYKDWFTASLGMGVTSTDPINQKATRGRELLLSPNMRISKTIGKHWRGNIKADYQKNQSKDEEHFAFKRYTAAAELEYLF